MDPWAYVFPLMGVFESRLTQCKLKELEAFSGAEHQHLGETGKEAGRNLDRSLLFEPGVPGRADARQLRHFLPPQARRPSPRRREQANVGRGYPRSSGAQKVAQFLTPDVIVSHGYES